VTPTNVCDEDSNMSLSSELSGKYTDINIYQRLIILYSLVGEKFNFQNIIGGNIYKAVFLLYRIRFNWTLIKQD